MLLGVNDVYLRLAELMSICGIHQYGIQVLYLPHIFAGWTTSSIIVSVKLFIIINDNGSSFLTINVELPLASQDPTGTPCRECQGQRISSGNSAEIFHFLTTADIEQTSCFD